MLEEDLIPPKRATTLHITRWNKKKKKTTKKKTKKKKKKKKKEKKQNKRNRMDQHSQEGAVKDERNPHPGKPPNRWGDQPGWWGKLRASEKSTADRLRREKQ